MKFMVQSVLIVILSMVMPTISNSQIEGDKAGKIQDVNRKTGEITFAKSEAAENIKMGDLFYVSIDGRNLQLRATFPMMTIVKCKASGEDRLLWNRLKKDMIVYRFAGSIENNQKFIKIESQTKIYKVGDRGPAGGWIFYDKGNSDDGWRFLEAAPEDQDAGLPWSNGKSLETGAVDEAIGTGKFNTEKIIKSQGNGRYAAKICTDYRGGSKKDWFLPSKDELELMFNFFYKKGVGDLTESYYWSSTESRITHAWYQGIDFSNPTIKYTTNGVRAIRAFAD